jgi:anti-anti-sigma regulatory factor
MMGKPLNQFDEAQAERRREHVRAVAESRRVARQQTQVQGLQQGIIDAEVRATRRAILSRYRHRLRKDPRTLVEEGFLALADRTTIVAGILIAALGASSARAAVMRAFDTRTGVLALAGHRGLHPWYADHTSTKDWAPAACDEALATGRPVLVENIATSPVFAGHPTQPLLLAAGTHAMHCYPLNDRNGQIAGLLALHYEAPGAYPALIDLATAAARAFTHRPEASGTDRPVLLGLQGRLDATTAPGFAARAYELVASATPPALVLDLCELQFLTVMGARLLLDVADACAWRGVPCYLVAKPGSDARTVIDRMDGTGPLRIADTIDSLPPEHRP